MNRLFLCLSRPGGVFLSLLMSGLWVVGVGQVAYAGALPGADGITPSAWIVSPGDDGVSGLAAPPTILGFAPTAGTVCAGGVATFTATVGNVSGSYSYTLTNGSSPLSGTASTTAFSQTLITSGTGVQNFTLSVEANGTTVAASNILTVAISTHPDYAALVDLFNSTNGPGWITKTGWLTSCDPCGWFGVTCTGGRVSQVNLPNNKLMGTLPTSLSALSNLQRLDLGNNQVSGALPASWSTLTNLQIIYLGANQLSGTLPASWSTLTNLQIIYLGANQLSGTLPASWSTLTNLQALELSSNQLSGPLPESWSGLTNLQLLFSLRNQLSGSLPASWSALSNLQYLNLAVNQLSGALPASWSALTNLQQLELYYNQLSGALPASWSVLTNLQYLTLLNNQLSGALPASWSTLTNLQALNLVSNQLSGALPASWSTLTNLQALDLSSNQLSGCYPASYTALSLVATNFVNNAALVGEGSAASWSAFLATGAGNDGFVATATASQATALVGSVVSLSITGGDASYSWLAPAGAQLSNPATSSVVSATLTTVGVQTFTGVVGFGGSCTHTATVSVTALALPTVLGFSPTAGTVCAGGVATFTATVGNVSGSYSYTLTNGSSPLSGTASTTAFSQTLLTSGTGVQNFTLSVEANGTTVAASSTLNVGSLLPATLLANGPIGCSNAVVTIQAGGIGSYTLVGPWGYSQSNTTGLFVVSAGGSYTGLANVSGCSSMGVVTVIEDTITPSATNFRPSGTLGAGRCRVELTGIGTGSGFVMTGPGGYVFSNVYRCPGTYAIVGLDVRLPGTYTLQIYSGSQRGSYTTVVSGSACP